MSPTRPLLSPSQSVTVSLMPLTPSSFARFGTCITSPLGPSLDEAPSSPPTPRHPAQQPTPVLANQNTALKSSPISPMINNYPTSNRHPSRPLMSMFSCFPRRLPVESAVKLPITILERHPYTSQTFSPLALSAADASTCFLVIVAPSLPTNASHLNGSASVSQPPDLANLKAFIAGGDQAVTYAPGTWHAPMIVLGKHRIDFVVTQFVNGVPSHDCQEVQVDGVHVDISSLDLPVRSVL